MPHADTDTGADVTARALALCEAARGRLRASTLDVAGWASVADIAAAAVRLTIKAKASHDAALSDADAPWWSNDDNCIVCGADALSWRIIQHDDDCPAMQLDAAIRAAGEAQ